MMNKYEHKGMNDAMSFFRSSDGEVLTMAFVNMQPLDSVYELSDAFCRGTLFPNIDKPFLAGGMR